MGKVTKFSIWGAVSSEKQRDNASLEEQETKGRSVGAAKGWEESAGPYIVPGESRTRWVNLIHAEQQIPELAQMLEDARMGRFDILVMYDYNRLRDLIDPVAKTLDAYGIQIYSISQPVEPLPPTEYNPYSSDSSSMMRGMSQIISRWQIADLKRKFRYGVTRRVRNGLHSINAPYGYTVINKDTPAEINENAGFAVAMKDKFLAGMPYIDIVRWLNENNAPTSRGGHWDKTIIQQILANPYYAGKVFFGRWKSIQDPHKNTSKVIKNPLVTFQDGKHTPLWTWDEYEAILLEFERRDEVPRGKPYALSGILSCSVCNKTLIRDSSYREPVLHCPGKYHTLITVSEAMALVPHAILKALLTTDKIPQPIQSAPAPVLDTDQIERERKKIHSRLERGIYTDDEAEEKIKALQSKLQSHADTAAERHRKDLQRMQFQSVLDEVKELRPVFPRWMRETDGRKVNILLSRLCETIAITPDGVITVHFRSYG